MEKTIKAGDYTFPAKSTAASLFSYKSNFGRDGLRDLVVLAKSISGDAKDKEEISLDEDFCFDVFFRFLWVFAKAGNKGIPPLEDWLAGFDMPPVDFAVATLPQVSDMLASAAKTSINSKNSQAAVRVK